jgi:hypothetical protein
VLRGQQGTPALVHAAGVKIEMRVLAVQHNTLSQGIRNIEARIGIGTSTPSANKFFVGTGAGQSGWQALTGAMLGSGPADTNHFLRGDLTWGMPDIAAVIVREVDANPSIPNLAILEFQSSFVITNQGSGVARVDLGTIPLAKLPTFAPNKALVSDANGILSAASLAAGQLDYLSGVSSNIQTQLNSKPTPAGSGGELQVRINASTLGAVTGSSSSGPDLTLIGLLSSQRFGAAPGPNQSAFTVSSYAVTGSNTTPVIDLAGTWNTTAAPTAFRLNISDTASDSSAALMNLLTDSQSKFKVDKNGNVVISGNLTVSTCTGCQGSTAHNMLSGSHTDTEAASAVRGDLITGQGASPSWKRKALGASGKLLGSDGTDADWHSLLGTANQVDVTNSSGDLTLSLPQDIATTSTPRFGRIGIGVAAAATTGITIAGPALSTDADQAIALFDASFSVTKNDANTRTFNGFLLKPTLNAGGSNTTTTLNIFAIDTVNTSLTGLTVNLASFSFGGSSKFSIDSAGNGIFAGALTVVSCAGCTANHNLLSATHPDVTAGSVARGDLIVGSSTPKWARLAKGGSGQFLGGDGTDTAWHTLAGTTNQVTVSNASGDLTVSLPQNIHTAATPQFARLGVGAAADATHILKVAGGTVTVDTHIVDLSETWNNGAVNFTGFKLNVTDSASGAGSLLADLQVGGTSKFKVDKDGNLTVVSCVGCTGSTAHNMLSSSHTDSTAATVVRGDLIVGKGASPKWERLNLGSAGGFVGSDGTDVLWRTLSGTANQIIVTPSAGNLTLSTPQSIGTGSLPQFAKLGLGVAAGTPLVTWANPAITAGLAILGTDTQYSVQPTAELALMHLNFRRLSGGTGQMYGIKINTEVDTVDMGAGLIIGNYGNADGAYLLNNGKGVASTATGFGFDNNRASGTTNEASATFLGNSIVMDDWTSTAGRGNDGPHNILMRRQGNQNANNPQLRINGNASAELIYTPEGAGYSTAATLWSIENAGGFKAKFNAAGDLAFAKGVVQSFSTNDATPTVGQFWMLGGSVDSQMHTKMPSAGFEMRNSDYTVAMFSVTSSATLAGSTTTVGALSAISGAFAGLAKIADGTRANPAFTFTSNTAFGIAKGLSSSAEDALALVGSNTAAPVQIANLNASGYSGVEFLDQTGALQTFAGYSNGAPNHFRINVLTGPLQFMINGTDALHIGTNFVSNFFKGADVVAAATITPTGNVFHVTGATGISAISSTGLTAGTVLTLIFDSNPVVSNGASLMLAGAANFNTSADDVLTVVWDGIKFRELSRSVN